MRLFARENAFRIILGLIVALTVCAAGCSDGRPEVHAVEVKIFLNDQPAEGAEVVLHPQGGEGKEAGLFPNGRVGSDGVANIMSYQPGDGAPAGEYKVTFTWTMTGDAGADPESAEADRDRFRGDFADPVKSKYSLTVSGDGPNTLEVRIP